MTHLSRALSVTILFFGKHQFLDLRAKVTKFYLWKILVFFQRREFWELMGSCIGKRSFDDDDAHRRARDFFD